MGVHFSLSFFFSLLLLVKTRFVLSKIHEAASNMGLINEEVSASNTRNITGSTSYNSIYRAEVLGIARVNTKHVLLLSHVCLLHSCAGPEGADAGLGVQKLYKLLEWREH